jgi:hypothetical protein
MSFIVIARSEATKQSRGRTVQPLDCFAALAMTDNPIIIQIHQEN